VLFRSRKRSPERPTIETGDQEKVAKNNDEKLKVLPTNNHTANMSATVHVKNISSKTTEQEVKDFFSFCGKINNISVTPTSGDATSSKSATVTFEKETAAKTALLLDHTTLNDATVEVSAASSLDQIAGNKSTDKDHDDELQQEDKPRSRIIAEYLAHGYTIGDKAIESALALDQQHGISNRFTSALTSFDHKYHATDKAKGVDAKFGVSDKTATVFSSLNSYYEMALGTPTGQRLAKLYEQGNKQVIDVHNEARRLADLKAGKSTPHPVSGTDKTECSCGGSEGKCGCAPGKCSCSSCSKNTESSGSKVDPEKAELHYTSGDHTACNCGGADGKCACEKGKCDCNSCAKNTSSATKA